MTTADDIDANRSRAAARVLMARDKPTFLRDWHVARLNKLAKQIERGEK